MLSKSKASKLTWDLFEVAKETTKKNIVSATGSGLLKVDEESLPTLFKLIDASIDEGFNKGHNNFINSLSKVADQKDSTTSDTKKKK